MKNKAIKNGFILLYMVIELIALIFVWQNWFATNIWFYYIGFVPITGFILYRTVLKFIHSMEER